MFSRTTLSIVFGVVVFAGIVFAGWRRNEPNRFDAQFQPGGEITLDLSIGAYTVRGTQDDKIRVEIDPWDLNAAHSEIQVTGNRARVVVEGPADEFHATIYVPQRSDIRVYQTIGEMRVVDVEGNKDLGLNIGKIWVDVSDPTGMKSVYAQVKIGNVNAAAWHRGQGGFFRSFRAGGQGPYSLKANLDIGDIELSD